MSPELGVLIMMNNYFHDVATALLIASGVAMWVIVRRLGNISQGQVTDYFLSIYKGITRLAQFSVVWIILGGIPRTIFYKDFEWANAVGKDQVPALIIKHILAFIFVGTGAYVWLKLSKRIRTIKEKKAA
jgi:hypothetical protein